MATVSIVISFSVGKIHEKNPTFLTKNKEWNNCPPQVVHAENTKQVMVEIKVWMCELPESSRQFLTLLPSQFSQTVSVGRVDSPPHWLEVRPHALFWPMPISRDLAYTCVLWLVLSPGSHWHFVLVPTWQTRGTALNPMPRPRGEKEISVVFGRPLNFGSC